MQLLLVEDDAASREVLSDFLTDSGYQVLEAGTAEAAFAVIDGVADIGMLLTDFQLPGSYDGVDVMDAFWKRHPHTCVLMVSGEPHAALDRLGGRSGARFLQKPFQLGQLKQMLEATIASAR